MAKNSHQNISAIVFAGGVGQRLWPLSRKKTPKQFEALINQQSTLKLSVDQLRPEFAWEDIYISTNQQYASIVRQQLPKIPPQNLFLEPAMRDVGPAVGYSLSMLAKKNPHKPVALIWADCLVKETDNYKQALFAGADYLKSSPNKFVFLGQKPRFANQNLGWIKVGKTLNQVNGFPIKEFVSWHYRPQADVANQYYQDKSYCWNPGYLVVNPAYVLDQFRKHSPSMYQQLNKLQQSYGTPDHKKQLQTIYPQMEKISFDNAILEKISPSQAVVIIIDMDWCDIGTWESLKEALQTHSQQNITQGNVQARHTKNSVIYSQTKQLVAAIDVDDVVIVVTQDAILVTPQASVPQIKSLLQKFEGTKLDKYT